jgi:hypothetical protein
MKNGSTIAKRLIILAYAVAFGVGTFTHWQDILGNGWITCKECSTLANLYWLTLAFLDPLAIFLVLIRLAPGIRLMQVILITDVAVNLTVGISEYRTYGHLTMPGLYFQAPFMVFLFATAPFVLRHSRLVSLGRIVSDGLDSDQSGSEPSKSHGR